MTIARVAGFRWWRAAGVFCLAAMVAAAAFAQSAACCRTGRVVNAEGAPVAGASVLDARGKLLTKTAADGTFSVPENVGRVEIVAAHAAPVFAAISAEKPVRIVVERPLETVTVSAYRSPLPTAD